MQYGNLECEKKKVHEEKKFKSYYVVWKRFCGAKFNEMVYLFKPYYVVWKHYDRVCAEFPKYCLNRTMQYGNAIALQDTSVTQRGLNRTMQYGNSIYADSISCNALCLNRTMQYGNLIARCPSKNFLFV